MFHAGVRNRVWWRGEIAIWDCDIAAILLRVCGPLGATTTSGIDVVYEGNLAVVI
jgi:hypothetical protein